MLTNVPGIRVHTDIESMMWALEEFFLSMLGVNIAVGRTPPGPARSRSGCWSSTSSARSPGWPPGSTTATGAPGRCPRWISGGRSNGRAGSAGHRLLVAVHQPNLRLFGDSDSRGQYGYRLITGAYTSSLWRMTFGFARRSNGTPGSRAAAWSASGKPRN